MRIGVYIVSFFIFVVYQIFNFINNNGDINDFVNNKVNQRVSDIEILKAVEVSKCLKKRSTNFRMISLEKIEKNQDILYKECIDYRMFFTMNNDIVRFDYLSKKFEENNVNYKVDNKKPNINYIYKY